MEIKGLDSDLAYVMSILKLELQKRLELQGHGSKSSSPLSNTIEYDIQAAANVLLSNMYVLDYGEAVDQGVPGSSVKFSDSSGAKHSKYIEGLIRWFQKKGFDPEEAKRLSFATANVHKKEGISTINSRRSYSGDGTKAGFITETLEQQGDRIFEILDRRIGTRLELTITNLFTETFKAFST